MLKWVSVPSLLQSGYHQKRIVDEDVPQTAFTSHKGFLEYLTLAFGLTDAPVAIQGEKVKVSGHLPLVEVEDLDDSLISSRCEVGQEQHLREVLCLLQEEKAACRNAASFPTLGACARACGE